MPLTIRCDNHQLCPRPSRVPVEDAGFTTTAAPDTQSLPIHGGHCQVGRPVRGMPWTARGGSSRTLRARRQAAAANVVISETAFVIVA